MHYLKLQKPLAFFDLETTGINPQEDRIIEISIITALPDGTTRTYTKKVKPEIAVPIESSMIHGIYDKDLKDEPSFEELADDILAEFADSDLAGYNVIKFDLPLLLAELHRVKKEFDISERRLVDAQKIFFMMEPRNLSAAYKFYCGEDIETLGGQAHSAETDTLATYHILNAQIKRYENVTQQDHDGKEFTPIQNDIEVLHRFSTDKMVDLSGRFVMNDNNEPCFNFGKHKGKTIEWVLTREPGFYDWMMKNDFAPDTKQHMHAARMRLLTKQLKK